jgi:hypothetical protein
MNLTQNLKQLIVYVETYFMKYDLIDNNLKHSQIELCPEQKEIIENPKQEYLSNQCELIIFDRR